MRNSIRMQILLAVIVLAALIVLGMFGLLRGDRGLLSFETDSLPAQGDFGDGTGIASRLVD
jgi:hypothetical protein